MTGPTNTQHPEDQAQKKNRNDLLKTGNEKGKINPTIGEYLVLPRVCHEFLQNAPFW